MKILLTVFSMFVALGFSHSSLAASSREILEKRLMIEPAYEAAWGQLFDEESYLSGTSPLNQYTNVIVINKAKNKQFLRLYTNRQLMLKTKVSTGREDVEYINWFGKIKHMFKGTTKSHWRHTTRGFYNIKRVEGASYRSGENNFQMPYAMFFNETSGLAVHQVPPDLTGGEKAGEAMLGKRASSGCVRVHKSVIQQIYYAVLAADKGEIPVINTRTGKQEIDRSGKPAYKKGYKTIVVVEEY